MDIDKFRGGLMGSLTRTQLKLRRLSIRADWRSTLNNIVANIVQHSPDLVSLALRQTFAKKELTMKLGNGIQCLALAVNKLAPISARGLKYLKLAVWCRLSPDPFGQRVCNLSHLTHLQIDKSFFEEQLQIMEAYNIGENLEFLRLDTEPNDKVFLRTPKLKELRMIDLFPLPADVCPILQTVRYGPGCESMNEIVREQRKLALESRGVTVLRVDNGPHALDEDMSATGRAVLRRPITDVCYACGENHTWA
jgi:hypothetical protein